MATKTAPNYTMDFLIILNLLLPSKVVWWVLPFNSISTALIDSALGGGFKYCLFSPLLGEDSHFD